MTVRTPVLSLLLALAGCAWLKPAPPPPPPDHAAAAARAAKLAAEKEKARQAEAHAAALERRAARLELQLWERSAMVGDLETRLEAARRDVVRAMAKLRTLATRAEAASAMAEADVALQSLSHSGRDGQESRQVRELMKQSTAEFAKENYGGALYLANQAKTTLLARAPRFGGAERADKRSGETAFQVPVPLQATASDHARSGPGPKFGESFGVKRGDSLTGRSYLGAWVRVSDATGREGWLPLSHLSRRTQP
jgi:hypothetical protein